jgi:hypothetical protein
MKTNYAAGKIGIATLLLIALTGCTTYVVQQPEPQAYTPPPPPDPVVVQSDPVPAPAPAVVVVQSDDDFYQPLSPYGQWVVVDGYGRCWRPAQVEAGWRPYSNGHWELTDAGWYWDSDEPWAWATYHYGRWELNGSYGWVWVPQTQWAPAWVSWREGGGYVGWAPLPPEPRGGVSINVSIAPAAFCFVEERRMHEPVRPTTVIVNNTTIINKTVNITKTKVVNKVVINEGPRSDEVERVSGRKFQAVSATDLRHKEEQPVAEKNRNARAVDNRGQQPQPQPANHPPQTRNQDQHPAPVVQPLSRGTEKEKPERPQQDRTQPVQPPKPVRAVEPKPAPVNPAPPPREVRPVEKPVEQNQPDVRNRNPQQGRPQREVTPAPKPEKAREVKPPKQQNQPAPRNDRNRNREAGGTNTTENSDQGGRR